MKMIELNASEFHRVTPIFRDIDHNIAVVYSVIEGNNPGRVFADNALAPTSALLFPEGTFFYVGGNENDSEFCQSLKSLLFGDILPHAAEKELILFSFSDAWRNRLDALLGEKGVIKVYRKVFAFNSEKFSVHKQWRDRIPDGFCIRQIDEQLAERQPAYRSIISSSKKFGFCLLREDQVVSEYVSIFVGKGEAEIDIHTHENYQGGGLATLTASAFIEACLSRGLRPNWACWLERRASWALAKKLGFEEKPDVPVHYWAENM